jgi:primosomal protein N'
VDRPVLSLDRPFTYGLDVALNAGIGSLVQVPFHGRLVRGWVLGPTDDLPKRMLAVKKVVSPVRSFDDRMLQLARWVSERYVAPLAAVLDAIGPPRVAGEEASPPGDAVAAAVAHPVTHPRLSEGYANATDLLRTLRGGSGVFGLRPAPDDESDVAVECVDAALRGGRSTIVLVPEADPLPATAAAVRTPSGRRSRCTSVAASALDTGCG